MYSFIVIIHIIVSIFLIAVILLQAGRGGGLADSFGGAQMQSLFGTNSRNVLTRATAICAIVFIITCLSLAIISSRRNKSLVEKINIPVPMEAPVAVDIPAELPEVDTVEPVEEVPVEAPQEVSQEVLPVLPQEQVPVNPEEVQ